MVRSRSRSFASLASAVAALAGIGSAAHADSLPLFPGVIHLNPFATPGWFPIPGPFNVVVPIGGISVQAGADGLISPFGWVWENEIDWIGLVGPVAVSINGRPPVIAIFGPGPDVYFAIFQADVPETGPFTKSLVNLPGSIVPVAWGTSVVEPPAPQGNQNYVVYTAASGASVTEPIGNVPTGAQRVYMSYGGGVYRITFTQPPPPCPGDGNGDRRVDFADLNLVLSMFGQQGPGLQGDMNGDNRVDFADLNLVLSNFGQQC